MASQACAVTGDPTDDMNGDIRDTLQSVPEVGPRPHSGVQELVKVLVVAEDDMAAHIKQKALWRDICAGQSTSLCCLQHQHHLHQHFSLQLATPIHTKVGSAKVHLN